METKFCPKCSTTKPIPEFGRNAARYDGLTGYCTSCVKVTQEESRKRKRLELLVFLGGVCTACGFSDPRALQIDHVKSDGGAERRGSVVSAQLLDRRVRAAPHRFQVLCANCNIIKRIELGEHGGAREYERVAPTQRVRGGRPRAAYESAEAGYLELLRVIDERRLIERSALPLPKPRWSSRYARCLNCRRDDRKYAAHGLCFTCNHKYTRAKVAYPDGVPTVTIS